MGGALGGGKSDALLASALSQVGNEHHRGIILRKTFGELRDLVERSFQLFLPLGGTFNRTEHRWRFLSGATVEFNFCDRADDKYQYQGRAFNFIGWDELGQMAPDSTENGEAVNSSYAFLLTRLRAVEGSGLRLECRSTCNPSGPGRGWIQQRWAIPNDGSASERIDPLNGYRRQFVPARLHHNLHLARTGYGRVLEGLPKADREALLLGRFDSYDSGAMFEWRNTLHGRPWHEHPGFRIPVGWRLWRGGDDGWTHPSVIYWLTEDPTYATIYVIDELYRTQLLPHELAERILERDMLIPMQDGFGNALTNRERLRGTYDSSAFAVRGEGEITRGQQMNRLGCRWESVEKWPGSRVAGIQNFHRLLQANPKAPPMKDKDGKPLFDAEGRPMTDRPGIVFFSKCVNAIKTIPTLIRSERDVEDIDDNSNDDCFDGVRYAIQHRRGKGTQIVPIYGL